MKEIIIEYDDENIQCPECHHFDVTKIVSDTNPFWYSCGDCFTDFD